MVECSQTLSGNHSYAPRKWLGDQGKAPNGERLLPWISGNYVTVLACICGKRPPNSEVSTIELALKETAAMRRLTFGEEPAEQGHLL